MFSARGPAIPEATWVPGTLHKGQIRPSSIGLEHAGGPKIRNRLAELGCGVPREWRIVSDHSKRGLVVEVPDGEDHARIVDWLVAAAVTVSAAPLTGKWRAAVFRKS
jgi:hypothetical protein